MVDDIPICLYTGLASLMKNLTSSSWLTIEASKLYNDLSQVCPPGTEFGLGKMELNFLLE